MRDWESETLRNDSFRNLQIDDRLGILKERIPLDQSLILNDDEKRARMKFFFQLAGLDYAQTYCIYRASRDGFKALDYNGKCKGVDSFLVVIKTTDNRVIGGYTSHGLRYNGSYADPKAWIFNIQYNDIFKWK